MTHHYRAGDRIKVMWSDGRYASIRWSPGTIVGYDYGDPHPTYYVTIDEDLDPKRRVVLLAEDIEPLTLLDEIVRPL